MYYALVHMLLEILRSNLAILVRIVIRSTAPIMMHFLSNHQSLLGRHVTTILHHFQ